MSPSSYNLPLFWLAAALAFGWLVHLLAPYLAPFLTAAVLGYIGAPLVGKLERHRVPRTAGAAAVLLLAIGLIFALLAVLAPLIARQAAQLAESVPAMLERMRAAAAAFAPGLEDSLQNLDWTGVGAKLSEQEGLIDGRLVGGIASYLGSGVDAAVVVAVNIVLVPLVMFYILRDWDAAVGHVDRLLPRRSAGKIREIVCACDRIVGEFLRAQLSVILVMIAVYSFLLWLTGIDFAFAIATVTGLFTFIPYFGFIVGLALALLVSWTQGGGFELAGWATLAMLVGTAIESFAVTPLIVGKRVGLHPVAILLLLAAGGGLFGFAGVLLALPAGAVGIVLLRYGRDRYLASQAYNDS